MYTSFTFERKRDSTMAERNRIEESQWYRLRVLGCTIGVFECYSLLVANLLISCSLSRDLPCTMSLEEMKSLFRVDDIIASAPQSITVLELSARSGKGLQEVLNWLDSTQPD